LQKKKDDDEEEGFRRLNNPNNNNNGGIQVEKVVNVWGSTAGAGSDFFHLYRKHRSVEVERLENMEQDWKKEQEDEEFQMRREQNAIECEERTRKRAEKRRKKKDNKKQRQIIKEQAGKLNNFPKDGSFMQQVAPICEKNLAVFHSFGDNNSSNSASGVQFCSDGLSSIATHTTTVIDSNDNEDMREKEQTPQMPVEVLQMKHGKNLIILEDPDF